MVELVCTDSMWCGASLDPPCLPPSTLLSIHPPLYPFPFCCLPLLLFPISVVSSVSSQQSMATVSLQPLARANTAVQTLVLSQVPPTLHDTYRVDLYDVYLCMVL